MRQRDKVTDWPMVKANVNPATLERIEAERAQTGLSRADLVREALEALFGEQRSQAR